MRKLTTLLTLILLSTMMAWAAPHRYVSNIEGDVNADGDVNIADVNVLIDAILSGEGPAECDVNHDGDISIADINYLIDLILTGPEIITVDTGVYLGVIGYNQTLNAMDMTALDTISAVGVNDFVAALTSQPGRILYYSVDQAINTLKSAKYPRNLQNVAVVTLTKGVDQGSLMMTDKYDTEAQYADAITARLANERIYGQPIKSYTIGLMNDNIKDANQFRNNLYALASDSAKAAEVTEMEQVTPCFEKIAEELVGRNMSETLTLIFPGVGSGTRIRFTLDDVDSETVNDSQIYIEGTFSLKSRSLVDVIYSGMTCNAGDSVAASSTDGMFVNMVFDGIQLDNEETIDKNKIQEWYWIEDQSVWEASTEFSAERLPEVDSVYASTLVMLLLDCSSVMDDCFAEMQDAVSTFIDRLQNIPEPEPVPDPGLITVNGVTFQMVAVDGGTFTMGAEQAMVDMGYANSDELPAHVVTLEPYFIGQTEVTQELWEAVMGTNPSAFTGDPMRPVEQVTWQDCQDFIAALNELTGKNFRLPTEAEWEFAARGGNMSSHFMYAGSDTIGDVAWYYENSYAMGLEHEDYGTHAVATKSANELGLFDMSGNVNEWCDDWYKPYGSEDTYDPAFSLNRRVIRGGCWFDAPIDCRSTCRDYQSAGMRTYSIGLRLAM